MLAAGLLLACGGDDDPSAETDLAGGTEVGAEETTAASPDEGEPSDDDETGAMPSETDDGPEPESTCGDGVVEGDEACDPGGALDTATCSHLCRLPGELQWTMDLREAGDVFEWEEADALGIGVSAQGPVAIIDQPGFRTVVVRANADGTAESATNWMESSVQLRSTAVAPDGRVALGGYQFGGNDPGFVAVLEVDGTPSLFETGGGYGSVRQVHLDQDTLIAAANEEGRLAVIGYEGGTEVWRHHFDDLDAEPGINHPLRFGDAILWGAGERNNLGVVPHALLVRPDGGAPVRVFASVGSRASFVGVAPLADAFADPAAPRVAIAGAHAPDSATTNPVVWLSGEGAPPVMELPKFGVAHVFPTSVAVDALGNSIVGLASDISSLGAVVKLAPDGALLWSRNLLDDAEDPDILHDVSDVAVDEEGYVYALTVRATLVRLSP
ncbi:MAG: hypothetical protein AAF721_07625 [Myxococcota bacterium]